MADAAADSQQAREQRGPPVTQRSYIAVNTRHVDEVWVEPSVVMWSRVTDQNGRSIWATWRLGEKKWIFQQPPAGKAPGDSEDQQGAPTPGDQLAPAPATGADPAVGDKKDVSKKARLS